MRRKDREVKDPAFIEAIIKCCTCCRIGFYDHGEVYIVPLNFGYETNGHGYTFYFHGASEGRKMELIQQSPKVGFEMDTNYALNEADTACGYSARFQSVIGTGVVRAVTAFDEKQHGLSLIMEHNTGKNHWQFNEKMVNTVSVFKLEVTQMSCKSHP